MNARDHGPLAPLALAYTGHVKAVHIGGPKDGLEHGFSCCPDRQLNEARTHVEYVCAGCDDTTATLVYVNGRNAQVWGGTRLFCPKCGCRSLRPEDPCPNPFGVTCRSRSCRAKWQVTVSGNLASLTSN